MKTQNDKPNLLNDQSKTIPLSHTIIKRLFILFFSLVFVSTAITYKYLIKETDNQFQEKLLEYISQRGQRDNELFHLVKKSAIQFKDEFLFHYKNNPKNDFSDWFTSHMTTHNDGTFRSLPKYFNGTWTSENTFEKGISIIIAPEVNVTKELQRRMAIAYEKIMQYGPAWQTQFVNLWFVGPEKLSLTYLPQIPWCLNMSADYNWETQEWFYGTSKQNNPERNSIWTDIYFDPPANHWVISSAAPIDIHDKQIGTVGIDIRLDDLFKRTLSNNSIISYSIILNQQGRIIVHPDKMTEIKTAIDTPLTVMSAKDKMLQSIFDKVKSVSSFPTIINDAENNQFIAVSRIEGPDWYSISISSKTLFQKKIEQNLWFMLIVALSLLITALVMIYWVVHKNIAQPIGLLTDATKNIAQGSHENIIQDTTIVTRQDEIGQLALNFNMMVEQVLAREKTLLISKEKWERTFNAISDIVTLQTPDMRIVHMNKSACSALLVSCEELNNQHCYEIFKNNTKPCPQCPVLHTKKTISPCTREMYDPKRDETFLVSASPVINEDGKLINIAQVAKNITPFKKLQEDKIHLATAIEQVYETVVITDKDGSIQYTNPAFERISGYSREEVMGKNPRILKSTRQDKQFYEQMWQTITAGDTWQGRLINKKKDGSFYTEEATISPVFDEAGIVVNFVAVKRDITDEIKMEKMLRQSQKMESIGTLAGGIAHDFNNILFPIVGHSEMLLEDIPENSPFRDGLKKIYTGAMRASELVKQILTFSRQEKGKLKLMKMQPIIKEALKLIRSTIPTTIEIKQNLQSDCGAIKADPTQIHQIVMNLATNAYHAMEKNGGKLNVKLKEVELEE
ncbi:MAG: PAS domain S-box protein, partial [Desulfobacula sp.]|uniref:PAS domain-containing protein n=1 Tax=Desulfobacula sp. TaxID=2593537 RepID=UPI0025C048F7